VAKLPAEIDLTYVNNRTFVYTDGLEMLNDIKRLRRKSGWTVIWRPQPEKYVFHVIGMNDEDPEHEPFAHFEIRAKVLYANFWSSIHPKEPMMDQLRRWFFSNGGPDKVASYLNETAKDPDPLPEEASVWSRLLSDDDF
jgi:hypothetical protein